MEYREKFELLCEGDSRILRINATKGEKYTVESGSMVAMSPSFNMEVKSGGLGKMFGRFMSGESAFIQEYSAHKDGELLLAPTASGDITKVELDNSIVYRISNGNFLACSEGIELQTKVKLKGGFGSGEGMFGLRASGVGTLFVNSCGSIYKINLGVGEEYIVDSEHLVLWNDDMKMSSQLANDTIAGSFFSGEGWVAKFTGPGTVWIQTRKPVVGAIKG